MCPASPPQPPPHGAYGEFDESFYTSDGYAEYLSDFESVANDTVVDPLLPIIRAEPGWTFLDVGCGMGGTILALRKRGFTADGIEVSPYCLQHSPAREWMRFGEVFRLPCEDRSYDVVICTNVFQYLTLPQMEESIRELVRVAKRYVALWVFNPAGTSWSQEANPDSARKEDTRGVSYEDYVDRFVRAGATLVDFTGDIPEDSYSPEWRFVFGIGA